MNTNDLPPAARVAVFIEAGVAANPDLSQSHDSIFLGDNKTCALGFAILGAGIEREYITFQACMARGAAFGDWQRANEALGIKIDGYSCESLSHAIARMNDNGASLPEICQSLREGELAKIAA